MLWSDCSCSSLLNSESKWLKSPLMVAKDAMYRMTPAIVSLWSGDEGNEAQPKHSTRDKELIHSPIIIIFLFLFFFFCSHMVLHGVQPWLPLLFLLCLFLPAPRST